MLETKLTTCASLLYQWILPRVTEAEKLKIDLQDFQAWTGEYGDKSYSDREILDALTQLKQLQLLNVSKTEVTLEVNQTSHPNLYAQVAENMVRGGCDRPNRYLLLLEIVASSIFLALTSVGVGLALAKLQPQSLTTPHPWSVLAGEKVNPGR
jgi:hypothetical protein